jgi:SlyX protein
MAESSRLDDLESRLTHLERAVQELSDVLIRQQKEIDLSLQRNQILVDRLASLQEQAEGTSAAEEVPPHY